MSKTAIVGSRNLTINNLEDYLPEGVTEIVSGGAKGVDTCAREYALSHGIKLTEFLPEYERYGRAAPLKRNDKIVDYSDFVLLFRTGNSRGTTYVLNYCIKNAKPYKLIESGDGFSPVL